MSDLQRALKRLRREDGGWSEVKLRVFSADHEFESALAEPLAALIEAVDGIHIKTDCDGKPVVIGMLKLGMAEIALLKAINGDAP